MTLRLPPRRNEWYRAGDVWERQKLKDELLIDEIIFSADELAGETISSFEFVNTSGVTIGQDYDSAISSDADGVSFSVTGTGSTTLSVTLSDDRVLRRRLQWHGLDVANFSDYGG